MPTALDLWFLSCVRFKLMIFNFFSMQLINYGNWTFFLLITNYVNWTWFPVLSYGLLPLLEYGKYQLQINIILLSVFLVGEMS